jgi:hypothetical protein
MNFEAAIWNLLAGAFKNEVYFLPSLLAGFIKPGSAHVVHGNKHIVITQIFGSQFIVIAKVLYIFPIVIVAISNIQLWLVDIGLVIGILAGFRI